MPDGDPRRYLNALPRSRCGPAALVAVAAVAADVDPPQSICGPHPAIAAVVGGVGIGRADECKAIEAVMEAVMERAPRKAGRESGMRKPRRESRMRELR